MVPKGTVAAELVHMHHRACRQYGIDCRLHISAAHRATEFTAPASKPGEDGKQVL